MSKPRKPLWDDEAFKRWVRDNAKRQGMPLHEVLSAAGVSRFYLKDPAESRHVNVVLNLAQILDASPAELFGLPATPGLEEAWRLSRQVGEEASRTERLTLIARIIAAQLAALVYVASDKANTDPTALMELVMREINPLPRNRKKKGDPEAA